MRRSRNPRTPAQFLILAGITLAGAVVTYATIHHALDQVMSGTHRQEQQLKQRPPVSAPTQRPAPPSDAETQRYREIAEAYRAAELRKQEAWERFYQPPRACLHPESVQRAEVCRANEQKQRKEFESAWAEQLLRERQAQQ